MDPNNLTPQELIERIAQLERQLARVTTERDMLKRTVYDDLRESVPYTPMTLDEARELMSAPQGEETILDVIAEYKKELGIRD